MTNALQLEQYFEHFALKQQQSLITAIYLPVKSDYNSSIKRMSK